MELNIKHIAAADEEAIPFSYDADLTQEEMYGAYPFQTPVHIQGEVRNHLGVLQLHASVHALYHTQCARCLAPICVQLETGCDMILSSRLQNEQRDDIYLLEGDTIDLDDIILPSLLLEVDMVYLCKPDCKGLCPVCGKNRNEGPCGCESRQIDSRMAVLQKLLDRES